VVWAEQGDFGAAVVGMIGDQPIVPDHKIMMLPFDDEDEAHYVCGVANSSPFRFAVDAYAINIQQDPHVFQNVHVPKYKSANPTHRKLAQLSRRAHDVVHQGELGDLRATEAESDRQAAQVWGLSAQELKEIQASLGLR